MKSSVCISTISIVGDGGPLDRAREIAEQFVVADIIGRAIAEFWWRKGSGGSGLSLRSDDLYSIVEFYTEDNFRQLVVAAETIPTFLRGLCDRKSGEGSTAE